MKLESSLRSMKKGFHHVNVEATQLLDNRELARWIKRRRKKKTFELV